MHFVLAHKMCFFFIIHQVAILVTKKKKLVDTIAELPCAMGIFKIK